MFRPFACYVGFRSFASGSGNRLVSFISLLAILGLVLGQALLILVMSIMNGFDYEMESRILGAVPHIRLFNEGGIKDFSDVENQLISHPNIQTVMPFSQVDGMLTHRGKARPVEVLGLDGELSRDFVGQFVPDQMRAVLGSVSDKSGSDSDGRGSTFDKHSSAKKIILASGVADKLSVDTGDRVTLLVPQVAPQVTSQAGSFGPRQLAPKVTSFVVAGVFSTHTTLDQRLVLTQLDTASELAGFKMGLNTYPQGVQIKLNDIYQSRETGFDLLRTLPSGYRFSDWIQTHGNLYQAIKMSRNMVSLLVFLIIAIAVFNVVSMLMMAVIDKRSAISILKTLGATNGDILSIFLTQGFLIGLVGSLFGVGIGVACALNASEMVVGLESLLGFNFLNSEVYPIDYLPSVLVWRDVFMVVVVALILNFAATLYPALRAAKTRPAEVLRYE